MSTKAKRQHRPDEARQRPLACQLATYLMAATAVAFTADRANAVVIYTNPTDVTVNSTNTSYNIDLDGDTVADFKFGYEIIGGQHNSYLQGLATSGGGAIGANRSRTRDRTDNLSYAPKYPAGVVVSSEAGGGANPREGASWQSLDGFAGCGGMQWEAAFTDTWGGRTWNYLSGVWGDGSNRAGSVQLVSGQANRWFTDTVSGISTGDGYVPVQFLIGGTAQSNVHYGWIRMQMSQLAAPDEGTVTIYDWAYESLPNTSILTGDVGTPSSPSLTWTGAGGGNWSAADATDNWLNGSTPAHFVADAKVTFGNSGAEAVTLTDDVTPSELTFNNTGNNFTLTSPGGYGIGNGSPGPLKLVKKGRGSVSISTRNTYTGGTDVQDGTLVIGSANALPAGKSLTIGANGTVVLASGLSAAGAAAVPEPSTLALLGVGAVGVLGCEGRRRKRRRCGKRLSGEGRRLMGLKEPPGR